MTPFKRKEKEMGKPFDPNKFLNDADKFVTNFGKGNDKKIKAGVENAKFTGKKFGQYLSGPKKTTSKPSSKAGPAAMGGNTGAMMNMKKGTVKKNGK